MKKWILLILAALVLGGGFVIWTFYGYIFDENLDSDESVTVYIPTGADFNDLRDTLEENNILDDLNSFEWVAERMKFDHVKPGRYLLEPGMSNREIVGLFRAGIQEPVDLTFNNVRTIEELAAVFAAQLEPDSSDFIQRFTDPLTLDSLGYTKETILCLFIPNTYEFFWDTTPEEVLQRMSREHKKFWEGTRTTKLNQTIFSKKEVYILASIVQKETLVNSEKPIVAGVYINRLQRQIPLQADPTVVYAVGDFSIRRVLNKHLKTDSPYNTYLYSGLPPGPICMPDISTIDAVLNYRKHNYLYFCASPENAGSHVFATNLKDHNRNAIAYQRWLNQRNIFE